MLFDTFLSRRDNRQQDDRRIVAIGITQSMVQETERKRLRRGVWKDGEEIGGGWI